MRNPPNVAQAGSYSEVSLFFKTEEENGLLLYAGSGRSGNNRPNQVSGTKRDVVVVVRSLIPMGILLYLYIFATNM